MNLSEPVLPPKIVTMAPLDRGVKCSHVVHVWGVIGKILTRHVANLGYDP